MFVSYSRETTFLQAVAMTFDGKHPCRLCHVVQKGQAQERQEHKNFAKQDDSLQLGLPPRIPMLFHPPRPAQMVEVTLVPDPRPESPPTPPPRG